MGLSDEDKQFIEEKLPPPYNSVKRYKEFFLPKIQVHIASCTIALRDVAAILNPLEKKYSRRFFCRIDDRNMTKSPASIVGKIRRSQENRDSLNLENFTTEMTDISRFRIICNFLSDTEMVAGCIEKNPKITDSLKIVDKSSTINQHPDERTSIKGERSIKFVLERKSNPGLLLEIQIMTQLQEAWDKKDHFLVYEKTRVNPGKGAETFPDYLDAKMFAMAELLYVADQYFEDLRKLAEENRA